MKNWRQASVFSALLAMGAASAAPPADRPLGVPQDWSNHTVVYTHVLTPQEAQQRGPKAMKKWMRDAQDPRFLVALTRRLNKETSAASVRSATLPPKNRPQWWKPVKPAKLTGDWNASLGSIGGSGSPDVYPAKYSFDINATPSCANDFVVYPTANPGTRSQWTGTFTGDAGANNTLTVNGTTLTAGAFSTGISSVDFANSGNKTNEATSLAAGVNGQVSATGVSAFVNASPNNNIVTFTYPSGTVPVAPTEALNNYTQSSVTTTSHADATLVGYNNLYETTCTGTVPSVMFAYNTGSGATTRTSPVTSYYDGGKQIAFVQSNSSNQAQLVLLKWSSASPGTPTSPTTPATAASAAAYRGCTAPCMYLMTFSGGADDLHSSPFVGYADDTLWVGDANGKLHKFTNVFTGTPAEVTSGGFPATVSTGNDLSPPVYDVNAKQVYVGSAFSGTTGGNFSRVDGTTGVVASSATLTTVTGASTGALAAPLLDQGNARVYAFLFSDGSPGTGTTGTNCTTLSPNPDGCRSIVQFATGFSAGNAGTKVWVGRGNNSPVLVFNEGTFDDAYYSSANGTGAMYICGGEPDNTYYATLWKIPINANVMGTPVQGAELGYHDNSTGRTGDCSTVTEVMNGSNEYLFVSVTGHGFQTGCVNDSPGGGCVYSFNLSALQAGAGTSAKWSGTFTGNPSSGDTIVVNGVTFTASSSSNTFPNFRNNGTATTTYNNLVALINANVSGFTAARSGTTLTITDDTTGSGISSSLVTESLTNLSLTFTDGTFAPWGTGNTAAAGLSIPGGTGGIVIDNVSSSTGASQIYFAGLAAIPGAGSTFNNAYQASQSNLQ
ncbi:MAG TPA: hypothetical protein VGH80_07845 [Xanthomonadaceae bacterium]|jgi:hypothetical protein